MCLASWNEKWLLFLLDTAKMAIKNGKSRETGNIMHKTQNMDNKIKKYNTEN